MSELQLELILFLSILAGISFIKMCEALALLFKELDRMNKVVRINDKVCERRIINAKRSTTPYTRRLNKHHQRR